ncbi:hypothetical protein ACFPRL_21630 [Pseudoclavibacter helvolus]
MPSGGTAWPCPPSPGSRPCRSSFRRNPSRRARPVPPRGCRCRACGRACAQAAASLPPRGSVVRWRLGPRLPSSRVVSPVLRGSSRRGWSASLKPPLVVPQASCAHYGT